MKFIASLVATLGFVAILAGSQTASGQESFSGKVAETMNAGGYTYVLVDTGSNKLWAAASLFAVKTGDAVAVPQAMPMTDFFSPSLKRKFPLIYFAGNITVNGATGAAAQLPPGHPDIGAAAAKTGQTPLPPGHPEIGGAANGSLPSGHPALPGKSAPTKANFAALKPAKDGKTVAQIYAASAKLGGQTVTLRGIVVKFNPDIMGKNWLHIQDGTGTGSNNDLLITSLDKAQVGDTVLVSGKVGLKKDFGAGYKYDVLVEDAKVTVE